MKEFSSFAWPHPAGGLGRETFGTEPNEIVVLVVPVLTSATAVGKLSRAASNPADKIVFPEGAIVHIFLLRVSDLAYEHSTVQV